MGNRLDSRAIFASLCAAVSLPVSINPFFPLIFAPIGMLFALACLAIETPTNGSTRVLALTATVLCVVFFAVGLHEVLVHPHVGGK